MITVRNLGKTYLDTGSKTEALKGVSFNIKKGEFISVMGPSGSGKSTLLHLLSFLDRPTEGDYQFLGKHQRELSDAELAHIRNKNMGFVFQSFNLLSTASVYENVELPLLYGNLPESNRRSAIEKAVAAVGLSGKILVEAGKLSGGEKQRAAIARALVTKPDIIFADEPTGNLDSKSGGEVMEVLESLNKKGHTIILVTHESYTASYGRRLIALRDGMVEKDEPIVKRANAGLLK